MVISRMLLHTVVLMGLGLASSSSLLQAMNNYGAMDKKNRKGYIQLTSYQFDGDDCDECDDAPEVLSGFERAMRCLSLRGQPIKINKMNRLFAERYIDLIDDIDDFNKLKQHQKRELRERILDIVGALRYGAWSKFLDRSAVVIMLCKQSLLDLIKRTEEKKDEEEVKFLKKLAERFEQIYQGKGRASAMIFLCNQEYHNLSIEEEESFSHELRDVLESTSLGDGAAKALFCECIKRCDSNSSENDLKRLSIMDLRDKWGKVCGHELKDVEKFFMALSGAEGPGFCEIGKDFSILIASAAVCSMLTFLGGFLIVIIVHGPKTLSYLVPVFIASGCVAAVVLVAGIGKNCGHYWMTKQL